MKKRTFRILEIKQSGDVYYIIEQKRFPLSWFGIKKITSWSRDLDYFSLTHNFKSMKHLREAIQNLRDLIAVRKEDYVKVLEEFEIEA